MRKLQIYCRCVALMLLSGVSYGVLAQEIVGPLSGLDSLSMSLDVQEPVSECSGLKAGRNADIGAKTEWSRTLLPVDTLSFAPSMDFPVLKTDGTIGYFPDFYYGAGVWNLHEGFNANLNMSVCASFGKHRYSGAGFGTGVSAMYARRLTDKLMFAAGGFYDRMSWGRFNENRVGINLLVGYQLTDKVSVYAYGNKVFTPNTAGLRFAPPMLWEDRYRERFGGMVHVKVNDVMSFSVSVEERRW